MNTHAASAAALCTALSTPSDDPAVVAHEVGASAAQLGDPLEDLLTTIEVAYLEARASDPEYRVIKAAMTAWHEQMTLFNLEVSCEDPLTTMATLAHVRSRIEDAYRVAGTRCRAPEAEYALVLMQFAERPRALPLEASMDVLRIARVLRLVFDADECFAPLTSRRYVVLAHRSRIDRVGDLRTVFAADGLDDAIERIWVESMPPSPDDVSWLLSELSR